MKHFIDAKYNIDIIFSIDAIFSINMKQRAKALSKKNRELSAAHSGVPAAGVRIILRKDVFHAS